MAAPNIKKELQKVRMLNGKVVKSVLFNGKAVGLGKYFAAMIDGQILYDVNEKPLLFSQTGELMYPLVVTK